MGLILRLHSDIVRCHVMVSIHVRHGSCGVHEGKGCKGLDDTALFKTAICGSGTRQFQILVSLITFFLFLPIKVVHNAGLSNGAAATYNNKFITISHLAAVR